MEYLSTNDFGLSVLFEQEKEDTLLIKAARLGKEDVVSLLLHARSPRSVCTPRYPKSYPKLPQKTKGTRVSVACYRKTGYIGSELPISGLMIGSRYRFVNPGTIFVEIRLADIEKIVPDNISVI